MPDPEVPDDDQQPEESPIIRDLRKKADRADAAEAKAEATERELTLHKAGLGALTDKQQKALTAAHEGDWDAEALKATADELGFAQTAEPAAPQIPAEELAAHQRVAAAAGGQPPPPPDLNAAIAAASTADEVKKILADAGMLAE